MSSIKEWEQIVAAKPELQKKVIESQESIASELTKIIDLAASNGITLTLKDLMTPSSHTTIDDELAMAAGGGSTAAAACGITGGVTGIGCGIGAIFSLGATAAVSATVVAGSAVASTIGGQVENG